MITIIIPCLFFQTIPVMLKRDGKGLGFSIAGGKGATPFRGKDEVCFDH